MFGSRPLNMGAELTCIFFGSYVFSGLEAAVLHFVY